MSSARRGRSHGKNGLIKEEIDRHIVENQPARLSTKMLAGSLPVKGFINLVCEMAVPEGPLDSA